MLEPSQISRATGFLTSSIDGLAGAISAQGIGVSEKLDSASVRVAEAVGAAGQKLDHTSATIASAVGELTTQTLRLREALDAAAEASSRYASHLVWATWALVLATIVLALVAVVR